MVDAINDLEGLVYGYENDGANKESKPGISPQGPHIYNVLIEAGNVYASYEAGKREAYSIIYIKIAEWSSPEGAAHCAA